MPYLAILLVVMLAACTAPPTQSTNMPQLEGRTFSGNMERDLRCGGPDCWGAVEFSFSQQTVTIRFRESVQINPGDLLLARGTIHQGSYPVKMTPRGVTFPNGRRSEYTLWLDGTCLIGHRLNTINNLQFPVKACPTQ